MLQEGKLGTAGRAGVAATLRQGSTSEVYGRTSSCRILCGMEGSGDISLSVLEGYGGAQGIPAWMEAIVEAGAVALYVDNSGFVYAYAKGCSKDEWIYTLAKFIQASLSTFRLE
jgi:hypothetical protein